MNPDNSLRKLSHMHGLTLACCALLIISALSTALPVKASPSISIGVDTNYDSYYYMQTVGIYANLTEDGVPKNDGILALEIDRPNTSRDPIIFRSVKGSLPTNPALLDDTLKILAIVPIKDVYTWQPVTSFKRGQTAYFNITIENTGTEKRGIIATSLFDLTIVPLSAGALGAPGNPLRLTIGKWSVAMSLEIPSWATVGTATIYVNIFKDFPSFGSGSGSYPLCEEKFATFQIKSSFGISTQFENYPTTENRITTTSGTYNFSWRVPPYPVLGEYKVYSAGNYTNASPVFNYTTFQVTPTSVPPQASFTYSPTAPYAGGTTYFDASASFSYNGTITNYHWNWGDESPENSTSSPFITHVFNTSGTFTVTLNVTDSQGLWAASIRQIPVSGPTPPVASFTFYPNPTWINASTTFDASSSTPGWNGTGFPPIVNYSWDWGDESPGNSTSSPTITHRFKDLGDFTITLTVTDSRGWIDSESRIVQVINVTEHPELVITDVTILGLYELTPDYYEPYKGWSGNIRVTVLNNGTTSATFDVSLYYANSTSYSLGMHSIIDLPSQASFTFTFQWNTSIVKPTMNYAITANVTILLGESNTENNRYNIVARVKGTGDINGDGVVNISDVNILGIYWQKTVPPNPPVNHARADTNLDGLINIKDINIVGTNWQKQYPP